MALRLPRSLQAQFALGLAGLVLLCAAAGAVAVGALRRSAGGTRRLALERLDRLEAAQDVVRRTMLIERGADRLVSAEDAETLRAAHLELSRQLDSLDELVERLGGSSEAVSVLDLHQAGQAVRNTVHLVAQIREQLLRDRPALPGQVAEEPDRPEREANLREFHAELQRQAAELIASAQAVSADSTREYREAVQALASASARDQALVFGLLVASVVAAVLIARLFLGRRVLGRLQQVSDHLRQGDPGAADSPHLSVDGADEIAEMAGAVEQFLEDRRRLAEADREAERRKAEEALRATEAELARAARVMILGEMGASIAHEVNQPLAAIVLNGKACLRWLSGAPPDLFEAREAVKRIVEDASRAGEVIARIRALTGKSTTERGPVDLNEVIEQVLVLAGAELQRSQVVLRTELGEDLPCVLADRIQLQQLLLNLLINATEAMREVTGRPRDLLIESEERDGGQVLVAVRDTGVGLDPTTLERIFDAFYTTKSGGMGMGLSISRSIVESHGGRLWVEQNEGPGTTFCFTLPRTATG
ncbi:MAG TPA: ATP-binding protein [Myxococcaceae bacterium]|nr:ATP-binding protein [Myxococcaceae bacterium]